MHPVFKTVGLEAERAGNNSIPILACQPNGRYEPVQCYKDLCFCVDEWSGNSLDGTVSSTQSVEEFAATYHFRNLDRNNNNYLEKKKKRLAKRFLKSNPKLKQCGRKITKYCDADRDNRMSLEEWVACVVFKQNDTDTPILKGFRASSTQSVEEFAATYHFRNLDRNNNNYLEKKKKRLAKRFLKSNPKLKQCGRKITKYCDADRDNRMSLEEWVACVVFKQNDTDTPILKGFRAVVPGVDQLSSRQSGISLDTSG
ncbi:SPARC-related modular calcium-binding protein 2-like [Panulirus ornatus]|uniref:SPARC-related modular calcium-binding protein 2-like n=1 Tax=Panulirus ornatus TaxID=150431 RepID=UPI003A85FF55